MYWYVSLLYGEVCALNRGEQQGVLTVRVVLPDCSYTQFSAYCAERWLGGFTHTADHTLRPTYKRTLVLSLMPDCYKRLGALLNGVRCSAGCYVAAVAAVFRAARGCFVAAVAKVFGAAWGCYAGAVAEVFSAARVVMQVP